MNRILVAEIGEEKITDLAIQIIEASAKISIECLEGSTAGWTDTPILKPAKNHNQTCFLMTQGMLPYILTYLTSRSVQPFQTLFNMIKSCDGKMTIQNG